MKNIAIHRPKGYVDQWLVSDNGQEWMFRQKVQELCIQCALLHNICSHITANCAVRTF